MFDVVLATNQNVFCRGKPGRDKSYPQTRILHGNLKHKWPGKKVYLNLMLSPEATNPESKSHTQDPQYGPESIWPNPAGERTARAGCPASVQVAFGDLQVGDSRMSLGNCSVAQYSIPLYLGYL